MSARQSERISSRPGLNYAAMHSGRNTTGNNAQQQKGRLRTIYEAITPTFLHLKQQPRVDTSVEVVEDQNSDQGHQGGLPEDLGAPAVRSQASEQDQPSARPRQETPVARQSGPPFGARRQLNAPQREIIDIQAIGEDDDFVEAPTGLEIRRNNTVHSNDNTAEHAAHDTPPRHENVQRTRLLQQIQAEQQRIADLEETQRLEAQLAELRARSASLTQASTGTCSHPTQASAKRGEYTDTELLQLLELNRLRGEKRVTDKLSSNNTQSRNTAHDNDDNNSVLDYDFDNIMGAALGNMGNNPGPSHLRAGRKVLAGKVITGNGSGINARAADMVVNPQVWPHVALQGEYLSQSLKFSELTYRLFVAGEMEIISSPQTPEVEREGRSALVKKLSYLLQGANTWPMLRNVYTSIMTKIEMNIFQWDNWERDFDREINWMLTKLRSEPTTQGKGQKPRRANQRSQDPFYCGDYQSNSCTRDSPHSVSLGGRSVMAHHICANCLKREGKRENHPSSDPGCPQRSD